MADPITIISVSAATPRTSSPLNEHINESKAMKVEPSIVKIMRIGKKFYC